MKVFRKRLRPFGIAHTHRETSIGGKFRALQCFLEKASLIAEVASEGIL
jgi:hypothetical protein